MSDFSYKTVCLLGRQPALGLAELERLYGAEHVKPIDGAAILDIDAETINFKSLGGTIKVMRVLSVQPTLAWDQLYKFLETSIPQHLQYLPDGKFTLGVSLYGIDVSLAQLNKDILKLKKVIKAAGKPARIVPNKALALSSAQVLHNKLTHRGAWELNLIKDGKRTVLAQTMFVQDIEAYAARDQARPKRDARVGMLPPKLAQILTNLATGNIEEKMADAPDKTLAKLKVLILDPFCGTGVVLQEALLMGYSVRGTDIDARMVDYAKANLQWLFGKYPSLQGQVAVEAADATRDRLPRFSAIASEVYLGKPLSVLPPKDKLQTIIDEADKVLTGFLKNLAEQPFWERDKSKRRICLAVPAWRTNDGKLLHLPSLEKLAQLGYTQLDLIHVAPDALVYFRPDQTVARQLLILEKE